MRLSGTTRGVSPPRPTPEPAPKHRILPGDVHRAPTASVEEFRDRKWAAPAHRVLENEGVQAHCAARRSDGVTCGLAAPIRAQIDSTWAEYEAEKQSFGVHALPSAVPMGGLAPATAPDGRRVGRPNLPFFASAQGRPVAIRDKNKRSDWDEWLAVSLA